MSPQSNCFIGLFEITLIVLGGQFFFLGDLIKTQEKYQKIILKDNIALKNLNMSIKTAVNCIHTPTAFHTYIQTVEFGL